LRLSEQIVKSIMLCLNSLNTSAKSPFGVANLGVYWRLPFANVNIFKAFTR